MTAQDRLVGALIGLSRAVDNNEHLITPDTNAALLRALTAATPAECEAALTALQQQKRLLVPNCFDCASPCGRTADCDFPALLDAAPDAPSPARNPRPPPTPAPSSTAGCSPSARKPTLPLTSSPTKARPKPASIHNPSTSACLFAEVVVFLPSRWYNQSIIPGRTNRP